MKYTVIALLFISHVSFAQFTPEDFKPLHGLVATWEMQTRRGAVMEQWTKTNDSLLKGRSFLLVDNDTIPQETLELRYADGIISYTPTVPGQNEGRPVSFRLVSAADGRYTFENKEHDFPQRIIYELGDRTLRVAVNGDTKDGFREIPYNFVMQ